MVENTTDAVVLLGRSSVRRRILALLFDRPERRLHLRGIARAVHASAGTVARELKRLVESGLVERTAEGRQVYFQADRDAPLFEPVLAIVQRTIGAPDVIRRHLAGVRNIESAFLYGSYARGTSVTPTSDVDLMIMGSPDLDELTDRVGAAERELGRPVNYTVLTDDEFEDRRRRGDRLVQSVEAGPTLPVVYRANA
jgi:predicted nucleotidyltransferase/predicted transcriptional regulator with HTH domain